MWLNKNKGTDANSNQNAVDITIAEWMTKQQRDFLYNNRHTGHYRMFYQADGYRYYKAPGGVGELATYLIVRNTPRRWEANEYYDKSTVNWMKFLKNVRDNDWMSAPGYNKKFTDKWFISSMGWEVAGANKDSQLGFSEGSKGKFQFSCVEVPNLDPKASTNGVGYGSC